MEQQAKFEGWAVVELMGHQREAGYVTTEAFGAGVLFRVDTPERPEREFILEQPEYASGTWTKTGAKVRRPASPAKSRLIGVGSIYAINPCTEEAARKAIENLYARPLILIEAPKVKELEAPRCAECGSLSGACPRECSSYDDTDDHRIDMCEECDHSIEECVCGEPDF